MASQNEKKIRLFGLNGLHKGDFEDKEHCRPVNECRPHCQLVQKFYGHKSVSEWDVKNCRLTGKIIFKKYLRLATYGTNLERHCEKNLLLMAF